MLKDDELSTTHIPGEPVREYAIPAPRAIFSNQAPPSLSAMPPCDCRQGRDKCACAAPPKPQMGPEAIKHVRKGGRVLFANDTWYLLPRRTGRASELSMPFNGSGRCPDLKGIYGADIYAPAAAESLRIERDSLQSQLRFVTGAFVAMAVAFLAVSLTLIWVLHK